MLIQYHLLWFYKNVDDFFCGAELEKLSSSVQGERAVYSYENMMVNMELVEIAVLLDYKMWPRVIMP